MRFRLLIAMVFLYSSSTWSQEELISFQGFETGETLWGDLVYSTPPCITGGDYWAAVAELGGISPSQGSMFWGIQDLNGDCGSSGFEWIELPQVDVSGFRDVICRIDVQVIGYDAGDDIELEAWFDGQPQERTVLIDGASDLSTPGWIEASVEVPNRISDFKLRIYVKQNGSDQAGIDNIRLEGLPLDPCSELMISEYVEGTSSTEHRNNYIEIFNPTENEVDLTGYELTNYTGKSLVPSSSLELLGSITPYGTLLVEDDREILGVEADLSTNSSVMNFNGDDKIGLMYNGKLIDIVGVVGDSLEFGKDLSLRRKSRVQGPNTDFDPQEWDVYGLEQIGDLKKHQSYCIGPGPEIEVYGLGLEIPDGKRASQVNDNTYFGYLDVGSSQSVTHTFVIRNSGITSLKIDRLEIAGVNESDFHVDPIPTTDLFPNDSLLLQVSFSPGGPGIRDANLKILNDDPSETNYEFLLQGEGTSYTGSPLMISTYYEGEANNRWLELTNVSGRDISANTFYLALYRQDALNAPISSKPSVKRAIPFMPAGAVLKFRASLNVSKPAYAIDGSEISTSVCSFNGDDVLVISSSDDQSCWENRVDIVGRAGVWGSDIAYLRKYGCEQQGPHTGFNPDHWLPFATEEIDSAQPEMNERLGEYYTGETQFKLNSWTNGLPDLNRNAVVLDDFSVSLNGELRACNLLVETGARLTVEKGHHIAVQNDLQVSGTLELMHGGELLMINNSGLIESTGRILIHRWSSPLNPYDYTYWSSPVRSADLMEVFRESDPNYIFTFSTPLFDDNDQDGEDDDGNAWAKATGAMIPGKGYASIAPRSLTSGNRQMLSFQGEVNNGYIHIPIEIQGPANSISDWNLIGNPYPSGLDAELVLNEPDNAKLLAGTFYFWTHNTPLKNDPDTGRSVYSSDDYAMYTIGTGGIRASSGGVTPDQFISSGQGFFVEAISEGILKLNNEMRNKGGAQNFFKNSIDGKNDTEDKIWLNLSNEEGAFSQILIGFKEGATTQFDQLYDGRRFSANSYVDFYSILDSLHLAIRGEPTFLGEKTIPLGLTVKSAEIDSLNISIDRLSGVLSQKEIHLFDRVLRISHDLRKAPYSFAISGEGVLDDRFTLMFGDQPLQTETLVPEVNGIIWFFEQGELMVRTRKNDEILRLQIFDLLGRSVADLNPAGRIAIIPDGKFSSNALYVLRVYLNNKETMTTKLLNLRP